MNKCSHNHRVYAVDMPGEPGKSDETQLPLEGDDFFNWLNDVFNALLIEKAIIVGISLGAWLGEKGIYRLYYKINGDKPIPEVMLNYQKLIAKHFNFRREIIPIFSDD